MLPYLSLLLALGKLPVLSIEASVANAPFASSWAYARRGDSVVLRARSTRAVTGFRWFRIEAISTALDNTQPRFHFEPVAYRSVEVESCRGLSTCLATVESSGETVPSALEGLGMAAFQVKAVAVGAPDVLLSSAGSESTLNGGLSPSVFRVAFRLDDTPLGYATELINTPYIFGSDGPAGQHQSDLLVGSDCADLVIYGQRRAARGSALKPFYTSSYQLDRQAPPLPRKAAIRRGDVVHFPGSRHVGLLFEDREPLGVLDEGDLILHTCWDKPTLQALGETRCASKPWRVLRFR